MRLVEFNCEYQDFEQMTDALIHDPRSKFGLFSQSYSKKLRLARFWFWGSEYVPETVAGFKFRKYQLIQPHLTNTLFDVDSVEEQLH